MAQSIDAREVRIQSGWSIEQVAAFTRASAEDVADYEAGVRRIGRNQLFDSVYRALAAALSRPSVRRRQTANRLTRI